MTHNKKHHPETVAIHAGRAPHEHEGVVNPPVYHVSTILFDTYDEFMKAESGTLPTSTYGRHGTESNRSFEAALAELEGADKCLLTTSGLSAISITLFALLSPGDHLLISDSVYSPTRFFCEHELKRANIEVEYYDPLIGAGIEKLIKPNTKVIYTESPGSLTFEVQDIPAIVKAAHAKGALVVLDNTWATPFYFRAFDFGVDVSIHSATKYIGGHSDLMMGVINTTEKLYSTIKRCYKNFGMAVGPDDLYLAQRGLRTMMLRVRQQEQTALEIAKWLKTQPQVSRVLHPALPDCPGHDLWKRDFKGSTGLFSVILKDKLSTEQLNAFLNKMELFKMGYSWGGYESLIIPLLAEKIRTVNKWQAEGSGFRIFCGMENIDDLKADLEVAFARI